VQSKNANCPQGKDKAAGYRLDQPQHTQDTLSFLEARLTNVGKSLEDGLRLTEY
jgi:hypothetical protein